MTFEYPISTKAQRIHNDAIVFDGHCDTLIDILTRKRAWNKFEGKGQVDLPRLQAGGVTAQIFAAFVRTDLRHKAPFETLRLIETMYQIVDDWPAEVILAATAEDVQRAKTEDKIAAILGMEGAEGLQGDLTILRAFHRLGVRNIGLTWNNRNEAADGVAEQRTGGRLTEFGVKLVKEMRRLGIMVDIAHLAPAGVTDLFEVYDGPIVCSHGNAQVVSNHRRNLSDEQLEKIAASGGIIGVTFVPPFLAEKSGKATLDKLLDHIDHIVKIAGIDHVGLGSDWDGFFKPTGDFLQHVGDTPMITEGLVRRGYTEIDICKFLGENWLRVFEQVAG